jgi:beta-glucanase (GH16 family)
MRPEQVVMDASGFQLILPPHSCDGAEVRTRDRVHFGEYSVLMQPPDSPGSLSAFFLYADVATANDEIDIELFNDGSHRVIVSAWMTGKQTRSETLTLPFDPRVAPHRYTIRWTVRALEFLADDRRLARWTDGYPASPMKLMVNAWWPIWLECASREEPRTLFTSTPTIRPLP